MVIKSAKYLTSAVKKEDFLSDKKEVAFVGRSNVGKSSLINALTGQKKLAKTSSTPGLTKMVNYFLINDEFYFVDLPGYGYSKTGKSHVKIWSSLIEDYFLLSKTLRLVFILVDIRHKPTELDEAMLKFLFYHNIPCKIIATKCDKVAKSKIGVSLQNIATSLGVGKANILAFSSETGYGKDKLLESIGELLKDETEE